MGSDGLSNIFHNDDGQTPGGPSGGITQAQLDAAVAASLTADKLLRGGTVDSVLDIPQDACGGSVWWVRNDPGSGRYSIPIGGTLDDIVRDDDFDNPDPPPIVVETPDWIIYNDTNILLEDGKKYRVDTNLVSEITLPPATAIVNGMVFTDLADTFCDNTLTIKKASPIDQFIGAVEGTEEITLRKSNTYLQIVGNGEVAGVGFYDTDVLTSDQYTRERVGFDGRFTVFGDQRLSGWDITNTVRDPTPYSSNYGTGQTPNIDFRQEGLYIPAGSKIYDIKFFGSFTGNMNSEAEIVVILRRGDYVNGVDNNAGLTDTIVGTISNIPSGNLMIVKRNIFNKPFEVEDDSMLLFFARGITPAQTNNAALSGHFSCLCDLKTDFLLSTTPLTPPGGSTLPLDIDVVYNTFFGGFNATATITNNTGSVVDDWQAILSGVNYDITSVFNATSIFIAPDGHVFSPTAPNQSIPVGGSVSFGFGGNTGEVGVNNPTAISETANTL